MRVGPLLWAVVSIVGAFSLGVLLGCVVTLTRGCWTDLRSTDWMLSEN